MCVCVCVCVCVAKPVTVELCCHATALIFLDLAASVRQKIVKKEKQIHVCRVYTLRSAP